MLINDAIRLNGHDLGIKKSFENEGKRKTSVVIRASQHNNF
jgi:hypothetical protein